VLFAGLSACSLLTDFGALSEGPVCAGDCAASTSGGDGAPNGDALAMTSMTDGPSMTDAPSDGGAWPITLVQSASANTMSNVASLPVSIAPTAAGSVVIVAVTQDRETTVNVSSIADNAAGGGNVYVSAGVRTIDDVCGNTVEIWYATNVKAGATRVTVALDTPAPYELWVMEVSGLSSTAPREAGKTIATQPAATLVSAPLVTTAGRAFVVSTMASCGDGKQLVGGSAFTALPALNGQDTAYLVTTAAGTYAASWTTTNDTWAASTVAFH